MAKALRTNTIERVALTLFPLTSLKSKRKLIHSLKLHLSLVIPLVCYNIVTEHIITLLNCTQRFLIVQDRLIDLDLIDLDLNSCYGIQRKLSTIVVPCSSTHLKVTFCLRD